MVVAYHLGGRLGMEQNGSGRRWFGVGWIFGFLAQSKIKTPKVPIQRLRKKSKLVADGWLHGNTQPSHHRNHA